MGFWNYFFDLVSAPWLVIESNDTYYLVYGIVYAEDSMQLLKSEKHSESGFLSVR